MIQFWVFILAMVLSGNADPCSDNDNEKYVVDGLIDDCESHCIFPVPEKMVDLPKQTNGICPEKLERKFIIFDDKILYVLKKATNCPPSMIYFISIL